MKEYRLHTDQIRSAASFLRAGDRVLLSGTVYTARDAAHKRLTDLLDSGQTLPFALRDAVIYYAGPTPPPPGHMIGSCGPTTSGRMDVYAPKLLDGGLAAMIGKGCRNDSVLEALRRNTGVYFCALGGAGALYAACVEQAEEIAFPELGCESVKRLTVREMPLFVGNDCRGGTLFASGE